MIRKVKKFKQHLTEQQNKHLEHIEDLYLFGSASLKHAEGILEGLISQLSGSSKEVINVSTKWDGAPAVICGINPDNGKFFVGTKSVFNKIPKINYTNKDIEENHSNSSDLQDKLKTALAEFPKLGIKGILQGDFLFTKKDLKKAKIGGVNHIIFRPNTIVYAIPEKTAIGKQISSCNVGIAFHTTYTGNSITNLRANFGVNIGNLKKVSSIWVVDPQHPDVSGSALFSEQQTKKALLLLDDIKKNVHSLSKFVDEIQKHPILISLLKTHSNFLIRSSIKTKSSQQFLRSIVEFINNTYDKKIENLKSEAGKNKTKEEKKYLLNMVKSNSFSFELVFEMKRKMVELKMLILQQLSKIQSIGTFLPDGKTGFKLTNHEGFVAIDKMGVGVVKLVDRLEFSKANFDLMKNWS
jgi:hypothetical protein